MHAGRHQGTRFAAPLLSLFTLIVFCSPVAQAQDPFIGEIRMFAGNFAPRGWALCNGQILSIAQNTALFTILGTTYGGNGQTTFALPDLRGRFPMHGGQGLGLTNRTLGEQGGDESRTLSVNEIPNHSHPAWGDSTVGLAGGPGGSLPARNAAGIPHYGGSANVQLASGLIGATGGSQPHAIVPPYTVVNFIIALEGIYPSQN